MSAQNDPIPGVAVAREGRVAVLTIVNPPVNALSRAVRAALIACIAEVQADDAVDAVVLAGEGGRFVAGADIREFDQPPTDPPLPAVIAAVEGCTKPVVAAVDGVALGGGCELAMACHERVASERARFGLPEVKLGLIPGSGGTQRLIRLIDPVRALELVATGSLVPAGEAVAAGLADAVVPAGELMAAATARALALVGQSPRRVCERPVRPVDRAAFDAAARRLLGRARGQRSVGEVVGLVGGTLELPFAEGVARERALFLELRESDQSKALRHLFLAERQAGKSAGTARPVGRPAVIGAGTMGSGIAATCLGAGLPVILVEPDAAARERAGGRIDDGLARLGRSQGWSAEAIAARKARLTLADALDAVAGCDLIIEAVYEDLAVKTALLAELGRVAAPGAILATNTSYLDIDALAAASGRADAVVGLHFFAPAEAMRLVEVVRGKAAAEDTVATAIGLARRLGKLPVVAGVCDGFIVNRILAIYRRESEHLLEDGALPHEVDAAMEAYGMPMGPFAVSDLSGLDIAWARRKRLAPTRDPRERVVPVADRLCEAGRLGRKTGQGWYRYADGKREPDEAVAALIAEASAARGIDRRSIPAEEIVRRLLAAMVNEAARIVEDGSAARASDVDLAIVNGLGFPAWRGGPLFAADTAGLAGVLATVRDLHAANGVGFAPAPLLERTVAAGGRISAVA